MTDNSKVVLRWEVNPAAVDKAEKAESGVFEMGGFKWTAKIERDADNAHFSLRCEADHRGAWKCEAAVDWKIIVPGRSFITNERQKILFMNNSYWHRTKAISWKAWYHMRKAFKDNATLVCYIDIIKYDRTTEFSAPNNKSNVILKIGNEKLHVYKEYLAYHSPVFDTLFFGNFVEKGKEEVEIKDVIYEEFLDLLNVIYLENVKITERTVMHLLKLADQFQMKRVLEMSQEYLIHSNGFDAVQKLIVADKYRLADLRDHCLKSFASVVELNNQLKLTPDATEFSDETKVAIYHWYLASESQ